jgi:hypothetical protein
MNSARRPSQLLVSRGMTAVELLAAASLAAMLLVSVLGVLTTLSAQSRELLRKTATAPWQQRVADQLRRDLDNARQLSSSRNRLALSGYVGGSGPLREPNLRAADVTYFVTSTSDATYLVREERARDALSNTTVSRQLVAGGIFKLQFVGPGVTPEGEYSGVVPRAGRIWLFADSGESPQVEVLWCR